MHVDGPHTSKSVHYHFSYIIIDLLKGRPLMSGDDRQRIPVERYGPVRKVVIVIYSQTLILPFAGRVSEQ